MEGPSMPIWLTIIISLASGIIATFVTLVVQYISDKKRVKKDLFLKLVSLRDCVFDDGEFRNYMNSVQIVFYKHKDVIAKYEAFVTSMVNNTYSKNQTIITDEFVAMLECMAKVTGYKNFDWQKIKKRYTAPDFHNEDIEEAAANDVVSSGLKKKTKPKNGDSNSERIKKDG